MKGLLLKDFYMALKYCRAYFFISIVFVICSIFEQNLFLMLYPVLLAGAVPVNLISYDEKSKWNVYAEVFPYTRKEMVSAKYIVTLVFLGISILLISLVQIVRMFLYDTGDWYSCLMTIGILPVLGIFAPCVLLPTVFKFGVEKGRIVFYAVIVAVCGAVGAVVELGMNISMFPVLSQLGSWFVLAAVALGGLLLILSWRLSVYFYQKREM